MAFPRITENPSSAQGKYGARKFKMPKKFIRMNGLRRDQTYTSIIVNAWPRNSKLMKNAKICNGRELGECWWTVNADEGTLTIISVPPKRNIIMKSALLPRNEPSSSIRQYRYVNVMLKRKLNPIVPKNRNVVTSRHTW